MGFDREKLKCLDEDRGVDEDRHREERRAQILRKLEELTGTPDEHDAALSPGKRTIVDPAPTGTQRPGDSTSYVRAAFARQPWEQQRAARFDDFLLTGLRDVLARLGDRKLRRATVASADPGIASRVATKPAKAASTAGRALWRAAERRAATLYRHAQDAGEVASEDPVLDEALRRCGAGHPLPAALCKQLESELGISLARVRVHTDGVAAAAAKAVRATAFTVGEDIFFAEGTFSPETRDGLQLLAHELTHVVQAYQGRTATSGSGIEVSRPGDSLEREADAMAERVARPGPGAVLKAQYQRPLVEPRAQASPQTRATTLLRQEARDSSRSDGTSSGERRGEREETRLGATHESFEVRNWRATRNTADESGAVADGGTQLVRVQSGGIAANADVRALTPDAQRYSVGFVQTMHHSTRRAIYADSDGNIVNTYVASRGEVMDQRTDLGSPAPWYNYGVRLGSSERHPGMTDNPAWEIPRSTSDHWYVSRLEGSESFTTYLVAMVGNDASTIIYLGNVRWNVNWAGRFDEELHFHGRPAHIGTAAASDEGGAVLSGPPANLGSMGEFVTATTDSLEGTRTGSGHGSGYAQDPELRAEGEREAARERTVDDLTGRYEGDRVTCQLNQAGRTIVGRYQARSGSRVVVWDLTGELGWSNEGSTGFRATARRAGSPPTGPLAALARPQAPLRLTLVFSGTDHLRVTVDEDQVHDMRRVDTTPIRSDSALEDAGSLDAASERTPLSAEQREQVTALVRSLRTHLRAAFEGDDLMRAAQLGQCNHVVREAFERVPPAQQELFGQTVREELAATMATFDGQSWSLLDWLYVAVAGQSARADAVHVDLGALERYLQISGSARSAVDGQMEYRYVISFTRFGGDVHIVEGGGATVGAMRVRAYPARRHGDTSTERGAMEWEQYYAIGNGSISAGLTGGASLGFEDGGQEVTTPFPWAPQDFAGRITEMQARAGFVGQVGGGGLDLAPSTSTVSIHGSGVFPPLQLEWDSQNIGAEGYIGADITDAEGYATGGWWLEERERGPVADPGAAEDREVRAGADVHLGFETDQYTLSARGRQALREVLAWNRGVLLAPNAQVRVEGYASRRYTPTRNRFLSEQRAYAVSDAIHGVYPTLHPDMQYFGEEAAERAGVPDGDNAQAWRRADVLINGTRVLRLYAADEGDHDSRSMAADDTASAPEVGMDASGEPMSPGRAGAPVQRKAVGASDARDAGAVAASGTRSAGQRLPHHDKIQRSFGSYHISGIRAHIGGRAADAANQLGASAYAHGDNVAFASTPDLHTAAHEAAHVMQQRSGVQLEAGIDGGAGDPYEQHADAIADAVVRGDSAESLLRSGPRGVTAGPVVQRKGKPGEVDTAELPEGTNFMVLSDGTVLIRNEWIQSDPDMTTTDEGISAPSRMKEILEALRASHLQWMDAAQIPALSRKIGVGGMDPKVKFKRYQIAFSVYALIGPPPSSDVVVASSGTGLAAIVRQSTIVPAPVDATKRVELSPAVRDRIITALERHTGLGADPAVRNTAINGGGRWAVTVDPDQKGVFIEFKQTLMEQLFTKKKWEAYLKKPSKEPGSGVLSDKEGGLEKPPQWLPKGTLDLTPKLPQYITGASVEVEVKWDLTVHPQAGFVLLPNHCDYEWSVKKNGKVVDHDTALLFDNRGTSLRLDGDPGTYEVSVVATSDHFLTPDKKFRAHVTLQAVTEKQADKQAFDKAAAGKDGPFVRDPKSGGLQLKPGQHATTAADELKTLAMTEGAVDELKKQGKLTEADHAVLKAELEKQRKALEEVGAKTKGGSPYIVRGTFVNRDDSTSTELKLIMHMMDRGTSDGQGHYSVLLHDTTLGSVTQHPGSAEGPVARDVHADYQRLEVAALDDMADHFHAHNDYPSGTVHLGVQQLTSGKVWEATRDTDNGRKTAKKILGGIALVGGVALLIIPGGGFISAAVFVVTATAGVASVAVEIEDRVAKEGELKFDRRLALDVLQVVSVALPFGTLTRVLSEARVVTKVGYLLAMTSVDAAQGFLIGAEVREQLRLVDANTSLQLAQATSEDQKQRIMADRDRKVAQIIGGAMVNGGFILISLGGGVKRVATTLRSGASIMVREPVSVLSGQGNESIQQTLKRGWFEHTNANGEKERVVLSDEERRFLEQEVSIKPGDKDGVPDAEGKDPATKDTPKDPAKDPSKDPPTDPAKDPAKDPANKGRVNEPVPGLYDSVNPKETPAGWTFHDDDPHPHPEHPEWIQIQTHVWAPDGSYGRIERSYDPKSKTLVMENAFLKDLPSWIEAGKPMKEGKGTPTVTYLTLRQMKLLGAKFGETKVVKMSTIQNIEAVMQLERMHRDGISYEQGVARTHSVNYATTSILQSGQMITGVKIDMSGAWGWKLSKMMDHFAMPEAERVELLNKYNLSPDDVVQVNYDIYIDVAPFKK